MYVVLTILSFNYYKMDETANKSMMFMMVALIVILLVALVGIGSAAYNLLQYGTIMGTVVSASSGKEDTEIVIAKPVSTATTESYDYNFDLKSGTPTPTIVAITSPNSNNAPSLAGVARTYAGNSPAAPSNPAPTMFPTGIKEEIVPEAAKQEIKGIEIKQTNLVSIKIDSVSINSPIVQDADGDAALDRGMWLYPTSYGHKELILLCHRRYFGTRDPRTCWFIDRVHIGDMVNITDNAGNVANYQIVSQSVREGTDLSVYRASDDDVIKIITCTPLGSSTHRLVTIARRVS